MISASSCRHQKLFRFNYCVQLTRALFLHNAKRQQMAGPEVYGWSHAHLRLTSILLHTCTNTQSGDAAKLYLVDFSKQPTSLFAKVADTLWNTQRGKSREETRSWVRWSQWKHIKKKRYMKKKCKDERRGGEKEHNHLVKHFTVKSSSDLSTQFPVCFSWANWKVVSVYTEPQGDRKHILAGLDRLGNAEKKRLLLSGDNSKGAVGELQCMCVCVCAQLPKSINCLHVFAITSACVLSCTFHVASMQEWDQRTVKGHSYIVGGNLTTAASRHQTALRKETSQVFRNFLDLM